MRITWKDAHERGFAIELSAAFPGGTDLGDELSENLDTDLIEVSIDSDGETDADGEGELSVEFYCLEPVDPNDESPVEPEFEFSVSKQIDAPVTNRSRRRMVRELDYDAATIDATVCCKGERVSYSVEECSMEFRGEPLTYFHYKVAYKWQTTGVVEF